MLSKSRRHLRRYKEIAGILARHGWGWALSRVGAQELHGRHAGIDEASHGPTHIREMLEELGPTFVKLGQILSTRPDVIPEAYVDELSKLQDTAQTVPFDEIRQVVESELGAPIPALFQAFCEEPIAPASLGQVHKARLMDGTPVVVKVQRPGIQQIIDTDIEIIFSRAQFLEKHYAKARIYGLMDLVDEFAITIREELDYTREARNADRLRDSLSSDRRVHVPRIYWSLTTGRVLTQEEIQGIKITDLPEHPIPGVDTKDVANRLASSFLKQIFVDGFFHADPHPGNILVNDAGDIILLDCGQVARLDPENRAGAVRMLMAFEQQDSRVLADEVLQLGVEQEEVDVRHLARELAKVMRTFYGLPARSVSMGKLLTRVLHVSTQHRIRLPAAFAVLAKVLANVDGICRQLNPDYNFTEVARAYVGRAVRSELQSQSTLNQLYRALVSGRNFVFDLPEYMDRLMRKLVEGTLRVEFKHQNLEGVADAFRAGSNRMSIAMIVGSTIIGSSLIVSIGRGEKSWFGLPLLGILGYAIATLFGAWLVIGILRSGRHK